MAHIINSAERDTAVMAALILAASAVAAALLAHVDASIAVTVKETLGLYSAALLGFCIVYYLGHPRSGY